jgi:hypothetical protein
MKIVFCGYGRAGFECYNQLVSRKDVTPSEVLIGLNNTFSKN